MIKHNRIFNIIDTLSVVVDNHYLAGSVNKLRTVCEILLMGINNYYKCVTADL